MSHEVKLEVFEGPIDLLLHLITRQRVDIYEVSLSEITEEYLAAIKGAENLDLETATGFLVVAATLLELKSARLLPSGPLDESDLRLLEERDLLLARLVECATYREAGAWLAAALERGAAFHGRSVSLEEPYLNLAPDLLAGLRLERLTRAAAKALTPKPQPVLDMSHVAPITASVRGAISELADRLSSAGSCDFRSLCGNATNRIDVVVRFLALLELFKAGAVDLGQVGRFGDITAVWTNEVGVGEVLEEADEYSLGLEAS